MADTCRAKQWAESRSCSEATQRARRFRGAFPSSRLPALNKVFQSERGNKGDEGRRLASLPQFETRSSHVRGASVRMSSAAFRSGHVSVDADGVYFWNDRRCRGERRSSAAGPGFGSLRVPPSVPLKNGEASLRRSGGRRTWLTAELLCSRKSWGRRGNLKACKSRALGEIAIQDGSRGHNASPSPLPVSRGQAREPAGEPVLCLRKGVSYVLFSDCPRMSDSGLPRW